MTGYTNGNGSNGIVRMVEERKLGIIGAVLQSGRRRALDLSHELTRKGAAAASAELLNDAVMGFVKLCYEQDETGFTFIDTVTGVIEKRPAPWGKQYRRYGITANERDCLKLYLNELQRLERPSPLFCYDALSTRWAVDIFTYGDLQSALKYWSIVQLDGPTFRELLDEVRRKRAGTL